MDPNPIWIDYTNWRGERRWRRITPSLVYWSVTNKWHTDPQYILLAVDEEDPDRKEKDFALLNIHAFSKDKPVGPEEAQ